jgi:hypothetical protein
MITKAQCVEWIAALRSGKYAQGTGGLRRLNRDGGDVYCCLGVLGDVVAKAAGCSWVNEAWEPGTNYGFLSSDDQIYHTGKLPSAFLPEDVQWRLIAMNDTERVDFDVIADYVERSVLPALLED